MAVSSYAASDLDSSIETDAVPIAPPPAHCQETEKHPKFEANSPTWSSPAKESAGDLSDPDEGDVKGSATGALVEFSCVDEPSSPSSAVTSSQLNAGDFKVENSAVEIGNSQSVHFGHNVRNQTDINVKTAKSVVIDRRQYNYTYPSYPNTVIHFQIIQVNAMLPGVLMIQQKTQIVWRTGKQTHGCTWVAVSQHWPQAVAYVHSIVARVVHPNMRQMSKHKAFSPLRLYIGCLWRPLLSTIRKPESRLKLTFSRGFPWRFHLGLV